MRFLRLDLRAFGPFADPGPIELGGGSRGLHLVLGPNEAGKSTALRAIRHLLFGFPARSGDDHVHKYDKLRIAAAILGEGGEELAFVRRKREVNPLWKYDDEEVLPADALSPFLGALDEAKFNDLFAMDHAELVAGGRAIIEGKGNLGSILFAAGSGLARVDEVRKALDAEVDELFKPTGKNPAINAALAELKAARDESEKAMLATSSWVELDKVLARERSRKEEVDLEIRRAEGDKRRLERLRDSLPVIDQLDRLQASLAGLGAAPVLSEGFADRRREATVARQVGSRSALAVEAALEGVARDLEAFGPRDPILDEADAIRRVRDDRSRYLEALEARPGDQARLARLEADARGLLLELRPGGSPEDARGVRVPASLKERIQALAQEQAKLEANAATAELEVAKQLAAGPPIGEGIPSPDARRLALALEESARQAQAQGDLEAQLATGRGEVARLEQQAAVDLLGLPLWSASIDDLETLAVPSGVTLDRFEVDARLADEGIEKAAADLARLLAEQARLDREIAREQSAGPVPSLEDLAGRRGLRDDEWRRIRRAWLDAEPVEAPGRLADDFEAAVDLADDLADRLRLEADAVAKQARRQGRLRELVGEVAEATEALDLAKARRADVDRAWLDLWGPLGLAPLPPREMKDWVAIRRADLVRQARAVRERRADLDRKASLVEEARADLGRHLTGLGEPPAGALETLGALLARARFTVERANAALRLEAARGDLARFEAARLDWKARWASTVGPLGLPDDASPALALKVVDRFDELARLLREVEDLRGQVDEKARFEARFEGDVRALAGRLSAGTLDVPAEATARDVAARFERAQVVEGRREEALKRQAADRAKLEKARLEVDRADAALAGLVVEAGCDSPDGLIEAERLSDEVKGLRKDLRALEGQLATLAGPVPVDRLREEARGVDPEAIEGRIGELAGRLEPLEAERERLGEEIGRCRQKLDAMDGGPAAAEAQQDVEGRLARLAIDVEKYARLRLASAVLRKAVEGYREKHQGPVLDRAGALFAGLTAGSFSGLRAEVDDKGQPVLLGVRGDGATLLKVDGMSEGTADQLYLALRLASLQTHLDDHEPMPLVVDDILVNFDDARALAALRALAELSGRTQVLFFTHHAHLVELARAALPDDVLFVHHLAYPPARAIGLAEPSAAEAGKPKRKKKAALPAGDERSPIGLEDAESLR